MSVRIRVQWNVMFVCAILLKTTILQKKSHLVCDNYLYTVRSKIYIYSTYETIMEIELVVLLTSNFLASFM